jgi:hypothetical protein
MVVCSSFRRVSTTLAWLALAITVLVASHATSNAGEIHKGAVMQVKANSIWFQDTAMLTHWQQLKKNGDAAALEAYEHKVLGNRDAWQFILPINVRILSRNLSKHQVNVEMKTEGRMADTKWSIAEEALER